MPHYFPDESNSRAGFYPIVYVNIIRAIKIKVHQLGKLISWPH